MQTIFQTTSGITVARWQVVCGWCHWEWQGI